MGSRWVDGQMEGQGSQGRQGATVCNLGEGHALTGSTDEACQGARSRWDSLMGWVTVRKKKAPRREGTAGTQAGGWLLSLLRWLRATVRVCVLM